MSTDDLAGTQLDNYLLTRPLGHGGMGVVYEGEDLALRRKVAIKVLAPQLLEDQRARRRFQQEIVYATAIEHPYVVPVYGAGYDCGVFYLVLRLIDGPDLHVELKNKGRFPEARALRLLGQVASALWAVHRLGTVHRDVKPHNVLLGCCGEADEHALLTDFGIAKALDHQSSTLTGMGAIGTPAYMAPEVCKGLPATALSDQYSLACMAYELLAGKAPFADADDPRKAHVEDEPPDLRESTEGLSDSLADAISRGLAKKPADRFPDVRALMAIDPRSKESFDQATAVSKLISGRSTEQAAVALVASPGLSDKAIATLTNSTSQTVARLRRRAARAELVGARRSSQPRRVDATKPAHPTD